MSRRSRRRIASPGGPYISPSQRLPRRFDNPVVVGAAGARSPLLPGQTSSLLSRVYEVPVRKLVTPRQNFSELKKLQISAPSRALFCVRRKQRKEVLFALGRAGFRGSAPKKHYRRTQDSQYRC